jgi:peptidoglycan/xylan/chitin deacetylase (PgdA/CDA1 family)
MSARLGRPGVILVALAVALAACGAPDGSVAPSGSATPSPTGSAATSAVPTPQASASDQPTVQPSATGALTTYVVVAGDTLYSIARRFATTVEQLQAWNGERYPTLLHDPGTLNVGWELIVAGEPDVTPIPTPVPTTAPTSSPVVAGCHAGNRVAAAPAGVYKRVPNAGKEVAITFDMGGRLDPALDILQFLMDNRVCATIFPTGDMSKTATGQKVLAVIRAHPELFEVGNHTKDHCDLVHGGGGSPTTAPCKTDGRPSTAFVQGQLTDAAATIEQYSGQAPVPYWRPPYGTYDQTLLNVAAGVGYTKTMLWDIDTIDWKPISDGGPTAQQIASKVVANAVNGSIVLDHLGGYETLDALRIMVPALRQRGFTLTSISDLFDGT